MKVTLTTNGHAPIVIPEGQTKFTIGRDNRADFQIPMISAIGDMHCSILIENGVAFIVDHGSKFGTFLNKLRVIPADEPLAKLKNGDEIRIGEKTAKFTIQITN